MSHCMCAWVYVFSVFVGVPGEPLYLAVRIVAGQSTCVNWVVKKEYPQFHLCCDENYQYYPEQEECPVVAPLAEQQET